MSAKRKSSPYVVDRIQRTRKQFRVDTFAAGGPGGANQNAVNSGVRITDLVTGLSVDCREERDQPQNKKKAFHRLVDKMIEHYCKEEVALIFKKEKELPVRTYRLTDNRVIDRRIPGKEFVAKKVLNGDLEEIHQRLLMKEVKE